MTPKSFYNILDNELDLNMMFLLLFLQEEVDTKILMEHPKVINWLLTLKRKGKIVDVQDKWVLTEDGKKALTLMPKAVKGAAKQSLISANELPATAERTPSLKELDTITLHTDLQNALYSIKKKRQILGFGNVYFIPSLKDLENFLLRFRRLHPDLWNPERIREILINFVKRCAKADRFSPAVKYYIIKEGSGSQLAAALEAYEDNAEKPEEETQHTITKTKDLFG